jgi:tyrosinase
LDTTRLGYIYDDTSDPLGGAARLATRMTRFGLSPADAANVKEIPMAQRKPAELVGANDRSIPIGNEGVETQVKLDQGVSRKIVDSLRASTSLAADSAEPDRVFLNLENIRGVNDAAVLDVYVNLPKGAKPEDNPDHLAGVVSLFGVRKATRRDSAHGGNGISETMEITDIVDKLHLNNALDLDHLDVRIVPRNQIRPGDDISVQRVSVYRQGQ